MSSQWIKISWGRNNILLYNIAVRTGTGSPVVADWFGEDVGTTIVRVKQQS